MKEEIMLQVEELEERIAPSALGNPGNKIPASQQHQQSRERRHRRPGVTGN